LTDLRTRKVTAGVDAIGDYHDFFGRHRAVLEARFRGGLANGSGDVSPAVGEAVREFPETGRATLDAVHFGAMEGTDERRNFCQWADHASQDVGVRHMAVKNVGTEAPDDARELCHLTQ